MKSNVPLRSRRNGFTLVEVTLSLCIAAFCLTNLLGLIPVGIASNQTSIEQTAAAWIASGIVEDLRTTPKSNPAADQTSPQYRFVIPATGTNTATQFLGQDGSAVGALNADAIPSENPRYRATLQFTAADPSKPNQKMATSVRILITWPALADRSASSAPSNFSGSYEAIVSLNR